MRPSGVLIPAHPYQICNWGPVDHIEWGDRPVNAQGGTHHILGLAAYALAVTSQSALLASCAIRNNISRKGRSAHGQVALSPYA